jgi:hypothetical protein
MIKPASTQIVAIRYQTGSKAKGPWNEVDADHPILVLESFDGEEDILFVQQKEKDHDWSRSYEYRYDTKTNSWDVTLPTSVATLRVMVSPVSDKVVAIRYQTGKKEKGTWKDVDTANPIVVLETFDTDLDTLFVQQKEADKKWSDSYKYRYDYRLDSWEVTPPVARKPLFIDSMEIKPYALFPTSTCSTLYSSLIGGAVKLNLSVDEHKPLYGYVEGAYSRGPSKSDWVDVMQAVNISAGFGYRVRLGKGLEIAPEAGYGMVLHLLDGDLDQDGTDSLEAFVDQQVRLSLHVNFTFVDAHEFFIAPLGVLLFEKERVAALYGFQAGMRFNF